MSPPASKPIHIFLFPLFILYPVLLPKNTFSVALPIKYPDSVPIITLSPPINLSLVWLRAALAPIITFLVQLDPIFLADW